MEFIVSPLYSEEEVHARVEELAGAIALSVPRDVMIVALLKGSFVFAADLIRALHLRGLTPQIDFMSLSSYAGTESCGEVTMRRDLAECVENRHVLLIDDILESGRTLAHALESIKARGAKSVQVAVLLEKPGKRKVEVAADFTGFIIPDHFVVGYGLDYANFYRELPFIGVLARP